MGVKIKNIRTIMTAPEGINLLVVKIETTDDGLYGLGCATFAYRILAVKKLIDDYISPLIIGLDVDNIEDIWHLIHYNGYWRNGAIENNALAGIDMALWDIKAKQAHMPLYQFFGGKCRQHVPIYRHVDGKSIPEILDRIAYYQDEGIQHLRCQYGGYGGNVLSQSVNNSSFKGTVINSKQYIKDTITMLETIRNQIGFDIELIHDVHERISPSEAIVFARELEPIKLFYLEDPISLENGQWLRLLRNKTITPIAQGELFNNVSEWHYLITERLIDFIRVHVTQIGGITPARKLQIFAEQFGVRTAWHGPGDMTPIAHMCNIHLDLSSTNFGIQEWSATDPPNAILQDITGPKDALKDVFIGIPQYKDGSITIDENIIGIGIDINEKEALKYPCNHEPTEWTQIRRPDGSLISP